MSQFLPMYLGEEHSQKYPKRGDALQIPCLQGLLEHAYGAFRAETELVYKGLSKCNILNKKMKENVFESL